MRWKQILSVVAGIITAYEISNLIKREKPYQQDEQDMFPISHQTNPANISDADKHHSNNKQERSVEIEKYIEAVASSSGRVRTVLIVLITASILSFSSIWNAQGVWLDRRIEIRRATLNLFDEKLRDQMFERDRDLFLRAESYYRYRSLDASNNDHKTLLMDEIKELEKRRSERSIVHVPFFGIEIDVNDMALFSGFAFVICLLWLRLSLLRELRNLRLTFMRAKNSGKIRLCYELLVMQQVLSNPPVHDQSSYKTWNFIPKLLFVLPLAIDLIQLRDVTIYLKSSIAFDPKQRFVFLLDVIFLIIIIILTVQCIYTSFKIDKVWRDTALDVDQD